MLLLYILFQFGHDDEENPNNSGIWKTSKAIM